MVLNAKTDLLVFKAKNIIEALYLFCRYGTGLFSFARLINDVTARFCTPFELHQVGPDKTLNTTENSQCRMHNGEWWLNGLRSKLATARV